MDLRRHVGHAPLIMAAGCVLFVDEQGRLLLQKRRDDGTWCYPGGTMELGEDFQTCAAREALEETGLVCRDLELFALNAGEKMHHIYPNGDEVYTAEAVFLCRHWTGELRAQEEEVVEQRFFPVDALPEPLMPVDRETILKFAAMQQTSVARN